MGFFKKIFDKKKFETARLLHAEESNKSIVLLIYLQTKSIAIKTIIKYMCLE